jgi:hypothetical protein
VKVYLAGPMRGHEGWNFAAFDDAERRWREVGHQPFSPAAAFRALGWEVGCPKLAKDSAHLTHVMTLDLACVAAADAIALLPGWEGSGGATMELAAAMFLRKPVYCALMMTLIKPVVAPWQFSPKAHCGICKGHGTVGGKYCAPCKGEGVVLIHHPFAVRVP